MTWSGLVFYCSNGLQTTGSRNELSPLGRFGLGAEYFASLTRRHSKTHPSRLRLPPAAAAAAATPGTGDAARHDPARVVTAGDWSGSSQHILAAADRIAVGSAPLPPTLTTAGSAPLPPTLTTAGSAPPSPPSPTASTVESPPPSPKASTGSQQIVIEGPLCEDYYKIREHLSTRKNSLCRSSGR
ncbi:unnamed protein product [Urochloa humidicola]